MKYFTIFVHVQRSKLFTANTEIIQTSIRMKEFRDYYYCCIAEKRIYHSLPQFNTLRQQKRMFFHGISSQEQWVKISSSVAIKLTLLMESHYVFSCFTQPMYEIIDCQELIDFQSEVGIHGRLIENLEKMNKQIENEVLKKYEIKED